MAEEKTIEQRLTALEDIVRDLQRRLLPPNPNWWENFPPMTDLEREAFQEAMEYGRAYRYADRPPDEPGEQT